MDKKATIHDVAKLAGVSITTVSRAINGNYPVKAETFEKISKAIEELEFTPNELAVSMITKKTKTFGVIIPSITNAFFSTLVKGINDISDKNGYTLFVCVSDNNEKELVEKLVNRQVDGIIIADSNLSKNKDFYKKVQKNTPLIFVNSYDDDFNYVSCDQEYGTLEALKYLKEKGHNKILFIRGVENSFSYNIKEEIYRREILNGKVLVIESGNKDESIVCTKNAVANFFEKDNSYTAIFACNDLMAIGAIMGLKERNISVPKEVSVIGFDNTFLCELVTPSLSTVDQKIFELGKNACESLLTIVSNDVKINKKLFSELIIRESC